LRWQPSSLFGTLPGVASGKGECSYCSQPATDLFEGSARSVFELGLVADGGLEPWVSRVRGLRQTPQLAFSRATTPFPSSSVNDTASLAGSDTLATCIASPAASVPSD
jgi:hypothetical protein